MEALWFSLFHLQGVNINMDEGNVNVVCLNTTGELTMGVSWAINEEGMVLVPPTSANQNVHR